MIVYSANPREGYVSKAAIETMRSSLAREIFQQDLIQIYSEQTAQRNALTEQSRHALQEVLVRMRSGTCANTDIEDMVSRLAEKLRHTSGKKQYGYLKAPLKELVDQIVDELAKDARVAEAYAKWGELRQEVLGTYKDQLPDPVPISRQKEFKNIKNLVIAEAMNISSHHFTFEGDETADILSSEISNEEINNEEITQEAERADLHLLEERVPILNEQLGGEEDFPPFALEQSPIPTNQSGQNDPGKSHIAWNVRYKAARVFLYGTENIEPDLGQAHGLFLEEANSGNALAMHDLGRMYADGLGTEIDNDVSFVWYQRALFAFLDIEVEQESRYVEYRIGKMYAAGLGTEQDYGEAARWFEPAASSNHKYAQYSLAGLYYRGQGVGQSYATAFRLYHRSAAQRVPYADYELAKMYRDGVGTAKNAAEAELHFKEAFHGFQCLEERSHDDKLQYRLGQMLYTGTGTEKDVAAAIEYLEKAVRLGNVHAQYMLGRIYLDPESGHKHIEKAIRWLTASAEHDNQYAQYRLGKLYLRGEDVPKDVAAAVQWLNASAGQGNQYAQYALGKLLLMGRDIPRDREAAVRWLIFSAEQGNIYARFLLDHLDSFRDPPLFLAAPRILHHLCRIFQGEQRRLSGGTGRQTESKLRRKLRQKKIAQGHAPDDHEFRQTTH